MIEPSASARPERQAPDESRTAGIIFATGTFFGMGLMLFFVQLWGRSQDTDLDHYRNVRDLVLETYVGELTEQDLLESALRGMLGELDDYSRYYVEDEVETVNRDTTGRTIGIGVIMRYAPHPTILFPVSNSPAETAGLKVGDRVLAIDGESVDGLDRDQLSQRMRGEEGTRVLMSVRGRDGKEREHEVQRAHLLVPSVRRVRLLQSDPMVGYLAITSFSNETLREFDIAVQAMQSQGLQGLVIDLRGNPGGVLSAAVRLSGRFIPEGVLTSTEGRGRPEIEYANEEDAKYVGLPLVVLIDGGSASASEVFAGALQDYRAAAIVGMPSYGKGVVQTISRYAERNAIAKLTTSYYYTPAHRNVQRSRDDSHAFGLLPDIQIEAPGNEANDVLQFIHSFEPSPAALPTLRQWASQDSELDLTIDPPKDSLLEAALNLFKGNLPLPLSNE